MSLVFLDDIFQVFIFLRKGVFEVQFFQIFNEL